MRLMAGKAIELGPAGAYVATNVKRLRGDLAYTELSKRLADAGRDIPPLAVRRIEEGARRVDVDDLVALAVALGVSPISLLMPTTDHREDLVVTPGAGQVPAEQLWAWLCGAAALPGSGQTFMEFGSNAWPKWQHDREGLNRLLRDLGHAEIDPLARRQVTRGTDGDD